MSLEELADDELAHFGTPRHSGRYPWGSGENPYQSSKRFLSYVDDMRKQGLTDTQIAKGLGLYTEDGKPWSTTYFRAMNSLAKDEVLKADIAQALKLREKNLSNVAIGKLMGKPESTIRNLLKEDGARRQSQVDGTADILKQEIAAKKYLDVGVGVEHYLHASDNTVKVAIEKLREEGYNLYYLKEPQVGTGKETTLKILTPPGVTYKELVANRGEVRGVQVFSMDGGTTYNGIKPPTNVDSKRIAIRYGGEGGEAKDGVIELRRGVDDISLGNARYAQVRIAVDGTHYLKGMAIYADDLPKGVDILFNTNKTTAKLQEDVDSGKAANLKMAAMKKQKADPINPFSSAIYQKNYVGPDGKEHLSPLNLVNEEGKWGDWSNTLSSQFLSKQPETLAKDQLNTRYEMAEQELNEISRLTNPAVKVKLLETFADSADSSAIHLKAAGLPRTASHVILPINSLKDNEIYAPNYNNGETVVLVRHPHGGIFEIPELRVNNRNQEAKRLIPNAKDAVGINAQVAARLSGADFDGDTVLVIPNNQGKVKTSPALVALKNFDPQTAYPKYDGMKVMSAADKQHKMGDISNLITDMSIAGATQAELARAVKHSMVVIDAEKHELNHKQSYIDNNIADLKKRYQGNGINARAGAATLISRAGREIRIPTQKGRPAAEGGPIDKETGELKYVPKNDSYVDKRTGNTVVKTQKVKELSVKNAYELVSTKGTPIEYVYADYSNKMKDLANRARKEMVNTPPIKQSESAKAAYRDVVATLKAHLNTALKNAPLERQAQVVANALAKSRIEASSIVDKSDIKKIRNAALQEARERVGARKTLVPIDEESWNAIQAGAISNNVLTKILNNTDLDVIRELATPRTQNVMSVALLSRAKNLLASGYTQAEVADALGISVSTLNKAVNG